MRMEGGGGEGGEGVRVVRVALRGTSFCSLGFKTRGISIVCVCVCGEISAI